MMFDFSVSRKLSWSRPSRSTAFEILYGGALVTLLAVVFRVVLVPGQSRYTLGSALVHATVLAAVVTGLLWAALRWCRDEQTALFGDHRHLIGLLTVFSAGVLIRLLFVDIVPINRDTGLYLYDAVKLSNGGVPIVDYHSRSPLFHWILAKSLAFGADPLLTARGLMIATSCLLGAAVYWLTRVVHSREGGLFASALFVLSPLTVVWGTWLKTEQVAVLLLLVALAILVPRLDDETIYAPYAAIGVLLGTAFLVRRTALVYAISIGLAILYYRWYRSDRSLLAEIARGGFMAAAMVVTVTLGYALVAGSVGATIELFRLHFLSTPPLSLFTGIDGVGGGSSSSTSLLCLRCHLKPLRVMSSVLIVTLPTALVLAAYFGQCFPKDTSDRLPGSGGASTRRLMLLVLGVFAVGALIFTRIALTGAFVSHAGFLVAVIGSLAAAGILYLRLPWADSEPPLSPELVVVGIVPVVLGTVYLLRDSPIHVTYYQEIFPFAAIFSGVFLCHSFSKVDVSTRQLFVLLLFVTSLLGLLVAPYVTSSMAGLDTVYQTSEGTVTTVHEIGDEITDRTDPDESIFTAQPIYALSADRSNVLDFSREAWYFRHDVPEEKQETSERLVGAIYSGDIAYVVAEQRTNEVMSNSDEVNTAIKENYCAVKSLRTDIQPHDTILYGHESRGECR